MNGLSRRQFIQSGAALTGATLLVGCGSDGQVIVQPDIAQDINDHIARKMPLWKKQYPGVEKLKIAVMGCVVNGPGESRHADIGISLPGTSETPIAPVYADGREMTTLKGGRIKEEFIDILEKYIQKRCIFPHPVRH